MICKFFGNKKGTGGGTASINYLLNERTEQGTARILKGDETLTREIINSLNFKHKACVGCLSFSENDISDESKKAIIESFETALLTPEMKDRVNILWVEHTDKKHLELNFVIPKVDLETKKSFNPYFHKNDFSRIDTFVDLTNAIYGFTNPKDPAKDQSIKNINHHAKTFKDHKALDNHFKELAIDGLIKNRDELISYIENELNGIVEITRKGKDYLGLKLPNDKKATRYKGEIYQNGNYADIFREENERKQSRAREISSSRDGENIKRLELKLIELIDKKSEFNRKRYQKRSLDTTLATDTNNLSAIDNNQYNSVFLASEANADTERLDQRWRYNNDPTEQDRNKSDRPSDISNDHKGLNDEFIRTAFNGIAERKSRFNSSNKGARESIHKSWKAIRDAEKRKSELAERKSELERTIREQTQLRNSYFQKLTFERIQASFNKFNDRIQRIKERFAKQQHTRALLQEFDDRIREIGAKIEQKLKDKSKITKKDSQKRQRQFSR
ncbi:MAG: relaxase/mobilization nuclease domain-containing protein [Campylobacter sp.]|nr:relaxase/mobilization nuclease domain-containing protein [Campylobacter sp.]MBR6612235.1 relaxase/mobilization nuclease domain-containing protein [Campylobacter sp.]